MLTFGELVVVDPRTLRPVVGVAQVTDAHTGDPLDTFDAAGVPAPVVSSARGYVGQFHTADDHPLVRLTFPEGDPVVIAARETTLEAAAVADIVERGRLSKEALDTTITTGIVRQVPPAARAEARAFLASEPAVAQAAAAAAGPAVEDAAEGLDLLTSTSTAVPPMPLRGMVSELPIVYDPCDAWGGQVWGADSVGKKIGRSSDGGRTWTEHCAAPFLNGTNTLSRLLATNDGEVLAVALEGVWRSTDWAGGTPTWTLVRSNPTPSFFYPWGADGDGTKFIVTHYAAAPNMLNSRYVYISLDAGQTWAQVYDTTERYGEADSSVSHIHGAAYDRWEDRFIVCEGHGPAAGVFESRDDGATWTKLKWGFTGAEGSTPTVVVATDHGIVFGSDAAANGVYVLPRGEDTIRQAWIWGGMTTTTLLGYAHMGYRDPRTGIVHIAYTSYEADRPAPVAASDGRVASQVWADPVPARMWRKLVIDHAGRLVMRCQTDNTIAYGTVGGRGIQSPTLLDPGRTLGGTVDGDRHTVALGRYATAKGTGALAANNATADSRSVALGNNARSALGGVAVGDGAKGGTPDTGLYGVGIGFGAQADQGGLAIGQQARAIHNRALALGPASRSGKTDGTSASFGTAVGGDAVVEASSNGTALGYGAKAMFARGTAVGALAESQFNDATALGEKAKATAQSTVALGGDAAATHARSVALGDGTATTYVDQVAIGPRHLEVTASTQPGTPAAGNARMFLRNTGGVHELCIRFPNGNVKVIATDT